MYQDNPKKYHEIEHTADAGIYASGNCLSEVFANAAFGMRNILYGNIEVVKKQKLKIELIEFTLEDLLVCWLSELNYHLCVESFLVSTIEALEIDLKDGKHILNAQLSGDYSKNYIDHLNTEIKAVTYHHLKLEKTGGKYVAQVIFDI
jgi:SHS2 domain-containing protein